MLRVFTLWMVLIVGAACAAEARDGSVYISGQIQTIDGKSPAAGVTVSLFSDAAQSATNKAVTSEPVGPIDTAQSLSNGSFVLKAPSPGRFTLKLDSDEFYPVEQQVRVGARGVSGAVLRAVRRPSVGLQLINPPSVAAAGGRIQAWIKPVFNANVWSNLHRARGRDARVTRNGGLTIRQAPDRDGNIQVILPDNLIPDQMSGFEVVARREGSGWGRAFVNGWPTAPLSIQLKPGATLRGIVKRRGGGPAANAMIMIIPASGPGYSSPNGTANVISTSADKEGQFHIADLPPGPYVVFAQDPGGGASIDSVELREPETTLTVTVRPR